MAEIKVVLHYDAGPWLIGRLQALATQGLNVDTCSERDDARFAKLMVEAEVLWHVLKPVTAEVMARARRLRFVHKVGIGVNTIDLDAARERGIAVCNMRGSDGRSRRRDGAAADAGEPAPHRPSTAAPAPAKVG